MGKRRGGGRKENHQEGQQGGWSDAMKDVGLVFGLTKKYTHTHTHTHPPNKDIMKPNTHSMHIFPGGSAGKESACNAGDPGSVPQLGRSPGGGHGKRRVFG